MPKKYTEVVILAEDRRQCSFVKRYLEKRGIRGRRIRIEPAPTGKGSGEAYVRRQYQIEVDSIRRRPHLHLGLVAVIDCDVVSCETRNNQLATELRSAGKEARQDDECIAILTPRRNIETWIYFLRGHEVNELDDYKSRIVNTDIGQAVDSFVGYCPQRINVAGVPPSLTIACDELRRFVRLEGQ